MQDVLGAAVELTLLARAGDDAAIRSRLAAILPDYESSGAPRA
jgi:hypothetical protein